MTPKPNEPVLPDDPGAKPAPPPIDLDESVAGEEDPGAALDGMVERPPRPASPPDPEAG